MKIIIILSLFFVFNTPSFALDLDRENIAVSYLDLPAEPMVRIEDRNYTVLYNAAYHENTFQQIVEENFHIEGFQPLHSGATILVDFQFDEILVSDTEILPKDRKVKDSDGNSLIEYYYVPVLTYKTQAQVIVSYDNGKSKTYKFGSKNKKFSASETVSTNEAEMVLTNDLPQITYELFTQFVLETVRDIDVKLSKKHGYNVVNTTDYLLVLDSRLHPEYKDYKRYYSLVERLFKQMTPFENLDNLKDDMQVVISFLDQIPKKYVSNKKADIKMRYASYYNLAKVYFYLDELEKSIIYYQKVIENDYHEGQSKRNIKDIEKLKDLFSVNQVNTRHFPIELERSVQNPQTQDSFIYLDAEIQITDSEWIEGKIELDNSIVDVVSELQNSEVVTIKFLNDNDEIVSKDLYAEFIDYIQLEDVKLQRISFSTKPNNKPVYSGKIAQGNLISRLAIQIFSSDKVSLYRFNNELILKKPQEPTGQSTSSTVFSFAFKKKLGQFFADCTSIQAKIKSGLYKNNREGLTQAVSDYTQCRD